MFRIVRQCNPVRVRKLIDIVISLGSELVKATKSYSNMILVFGIIK